MVYKHLKINLIKSDRLIDIVFWCIISIGVYISSIGIYLYGRKYVYINKIYICISRIYIHIYTYIYISRIIYVYEE